MSAITPSSSVEREPGLAEAPSDLYFGLSAMAWAKIVIVSVLMILLFRFNLVRLWLKTNPFTGEANWGHSIVVPVIGVYYLYIHREELLRAQMGTAWSGLLFLVGGVLLFGYGIWPGQNDFVKDFGMVVTLFGVVLLLCGWQVMKIAWFPIAFLVCAIPWPGLVYSWVASPLQKLAAQVAVFTLNFVGVGAQNAGTKIFINGKDGVRTLNVAEACAGMRSLMTFISVAAAVAFLSARPMWQKLVITLSAIPIAIFCNVMRVSGQGLLDHYVSVELSQSFAHAFVGTIMLIPGFFIILAVGWFLDRLFIEEVDEKVRLAQAAAAANSTWTRSMPEKAKVVEIPRQRTVAAPTANATSSAPAPRAVVAPQRSATVAAPRPAAPNPPAKAKAGSAPPAVIPPRPVAVKRTAANGGGTAGGNSASEGRS